MADDPNVDSEPQESSLQELFDLFISHTTSASPSPPATTNIIVIPQLQPLSPPPSEAGDALVHEVVPNASIAEHPPEIVVPQPPSPPPSEPGDIHHDEFGVVLNPTLAEIINFMEENILTSLANGLGFPNLPNNWKRIVYHAYNFAFSETVLHVPRIHRNTLITRAIAIAKQRCVESNPLWAAEEDQLIDIDGVEVLASTSKERFRMKLHSTIAKAEKTFHNNALQKTIYLLTSRPGYPAMMPHIPGPPGTLFNNDQRGVVAWYLTWQESYGYCMWHNYYDYQIQWFDSYNIRNLLFCALRDADSAGYFGLQEAYQTDGGIWTWRPLRARGSAAVSIVSYALASVSVSMRADFLQERRWDQEVTCLRRRAAVEEEQQKIYSLLNKILTLSVFGLSALQCGRARSALIQLLEDLEYDSAL